VLGTGLKLHILKGVTGVTETATKDCVVFQCIHHGTETKNKRKFANMFQDLDTPPISGLEFDPFSIFIIQHIKELNI